MTAPDPWRWPPLIPRSRAPWPLRWRDTVLTLIAWFVLIWVLRDALLTLVAGISPDAAARTTAWLEHRLSPLLGHLVPMAPAAFWGDFNDFLYAACVFVVWLTAWGWLNRRTLQRQPPPVAPGAGPALAAVAPRDAVPWQARRLLVQFDGDGEVVHAWADDPSNG